jgi:hypothetical protein
LDPINCDPLIPGILKTLELGCEMTLPNVPANLEYLMDANTVGATKGEASF